ncbi:MAG: hypothetical protein H6707_00685 [Deltaproteobacteria bacterium]|nr:hypothetical protein [Deltaproteobacteria bacterium]
MAFRISLFTVAILTTASCGLPIAEPTSGGSGKAEGFNVANDLARFHPKLAEPSYQVYVSETRAGQASSTTIYSASDWPIWSGGIARRWQRYAPRRDVGHSPPDYWRTESVAAAERAPVEKYDALVGNSSDYLACGGRLLDAAEQPLTRRDLLTTAAYCASWTREAWQERGAPAFRDSRLLSAVDAAWPSVAPDQLVPVTRGVGLATAWELSVHGPFRPVLPEYWNGHCGGWVWQSSTTPPPAREIVVRYLPDASPPIQACKPGTDQTGCVTFRAADIEALLAEVSIGAPITTLGSRCNSESSALLTEIAETGRVSDDRCRDLNPGALHIALVGLLQRGVDGERLAPGVDVTADYEVWNYPVIGFSFREVGVYTNRAAARRRVLAAHAGDGERILVADADRWVEIAMTLTLQDLSEELSLPAAERHRTKRFPLRYLLELKSDPEAVGLGQKRIVGGEWLDESRLTHPDFLFLARADQPLVRHPFESNPYVNTAVVRALHACANDPQSCAPRD